MMNTKECLQSFENTVGVYLADLEKYDMEQLLLKPSDDQWSLGQMYIHLIQATQFMALRNVEACRVMDAPQDPISGITDAGKAVMALGCFPPIAVHVPPSEAYTPQQPLSKEQISEGLQQVVQKMQEIEPLLDAIPTNHTVPHPRFGGLNAKEWFALIEMHYRHHFLQKKRLEEFLEIKI